MKKSKILTSVIASASILSTIIPLVSCSAAKAAATNNNTVSVNNLSATGYCKIVFEQPSGVVMTGAKTVQVKKNKMFGTVKTPIVSKKQIYIFRLI